MKKILPYFLVFFVAFVIFGFINSGNTFADPDSFYHIKITQLTWENGPVKVFPYLPFTTLNYFFADHHFLYHVLLIPFILIFGAITGMKVATAFFAALATLTYFFILKSFKLKFPLWNTALFLGASGFVFRAGLAKASAPGIILSMLIFWAMLKRKYYLIFALCFIYVYTHGGWPMVFIILGAVLLGRIFTRWNRGARTIRTLILREDFILSGAVFAGISAGLVINPFFPSNLFFYRDQILEIALRGYSGVINVGMEWYPAKPLNILGDSSSLVAVFGGAIVVLMSAMTNAKIRRANRQICRHQAEKFTAALLMALIFLVLTLRSQRHIEYFEPFFGLFSAIFLTLALASVHEHLFLKYLRSIFSWSKLVYCFIIAYVFVGAPLLGVRTILGVKKLYDQGIPIDKYADSSKYMADNSQPGDLVVTSDWDDFPPLFFYNSKNYYIAGLDPVFFYRQNPELYAEWANITTAKQKTGIGVLLGDKLQAKYFLVEKDHRDLIINLQTEPRLQIVFDGRESRVYRVK